ncbi:hypothetical protein MACK_003313 [Theileria orientalis]|uniref:Casein kinase substrate phosphoprotein PP28 domain-containing protein n=1 Tax=Theileria orientalis TaxID=68886 RepID=A0A976SII9_THEOR|nr:hypothetical protein MACK_003313 [Theileria orientalis]
MGFRGRGSHKKFTAKGRSRYIASVDEIIARNKELSEPETDRKSEEEGDSPNEPNESEESDESESESESEYEPLIEVYNPNKARTSIEKTGIVELSRREREELERQKFEREKMKLMAQGKLPKAKADLERLAKIRKQREEAMARKLEKLKL